ncbi:MAG: HNH endonuclease [Proteobacteria bacterium]|nr:HNH endonuclease [Pseudomonadota bacterium]
MVSAVLDRCAGVARCVAHQKAAVSREFSAGVQIVQIVQVPIPSGRKSCAGVWWCLDVQQCLERGVYAGEKAVAAECNALRNAVQSRAKLCIVTDETQGPSEARASLSGRGAARVDYTRRGKRRRRKEWVIFNRDEFRCVYCGKSSVEDGVKLEADHIVARSAGGKDSAGNLVTACRGCNRSKFDEELDPETRARLEALVETRNRARRISGELPVDLGRQATTNSHAAAADPSSLSTSEGSESPVETES